MKSLTEQRLDAMERIVFQALTVLHDRGTLPLQELIPQLESSDYALVTGYEMQPNPVLQEMICALVKIANAKPD
jgi:hypothetical protein